MNGGERHPVEPNSGKRIFRMGAAASLLMAVGVVLVLASAGCGRTAKIERGPYEALGEVAAKATSRLLGDKGKIVLLVSEADNNASTALGMAVQTFNDTLKHAGGVQVTATETIKPAAAIPVSGAEPLTPAKLAELLAKHVTADALVSFVGVPRLTLEQMRQLPQPRPKVVAVVTFNPPTKAMFAQGVLHLAVLAEPVADAAKRTPATTLEWFDANYRLVTAANSGSLPF